MPINPVVAILKARDSYWFIPTALVTAALLAGVLIPLIDAAVGDGWLVSATTIMPAEPASARDTLTTLAAAIIGVAGVAFSVTIVAVSFASSNFGPRLIGNFMADRINQVVLGIFLATFVYCMVVLRAVQGVGGAGEDTFVPQIAVMVAMLLALTCVAALIVYIHHVPESINVMNLVSDIGLRLRTDIRHLFDAAEKEEKDSADTPFLGRGSPAGPKTACARAPGTGYIQHIDIAKVREAARGANAQITVLQRPGDFVVKDEALMLAGADAPLDEATRSALAAAVTLGRERTGMQDVLFLSDQLVEIVGRALSQSLNDPHTAVLCLDWLRGGLQAFAEGPVIDTPDPADPVQYRRIGFADMTKRSFGRMRPYIATDRTVTLHALVVLADIARAATFADRARVTVAEMHALARSARELQPESEAHAEIKAVFEAEMARVAERWGTDVTGGTTPAVSVAVAT